MDIELQVIKHLARDAQATVPVVDQYCQQYKQLFPEVRSYEYFKYLHMGILGTAGRKSLPELAKTVGLSSSQPLHHFLTNSPWSILEVRQQRLGIIRSLVKGRELFLLVDETGDRKKGKTTDYVTRQYLGSVGKVDQGIVSVNAYGISEGITFPLSFKTFKPKQTLKEGDTYKTKMKLASELVTELVEEGFEFELVLGDSAYGESSGFIETLESKGLSWILSIRSDHGVWMQEGERIRTNKWCKFERKFSDGKSEERYIREVVYGRRGRKTYWQLTTNPETMPENSTSFVMTNLKHKPSELKKMIGNLYGLRTWVEYGFRQCKQELGWTSYRLTSCQDIERWWEIVMSVYLLVSAQAYGKKVSERERNESPTDREGEVYRPSHAYWKDSSGWKSMLENLRLLIQPLVLLQLIFPWILEFPNRGLLLGFHELIAEVNRASMYFLDG